MHYFSNLFLIKNSTYFGQIYCQSSGVSTLYTWRQVFVMLIYVDCLLARSGWILTSLADSQHHQYDKYLSLRIQCWDSWWWTVDLSETYRVLYQK